MRLAKTPADVGTIVLVPFRVVGRLLKWEEIDEIGRPTGALFSPPGCDHECLVVTPAELAGFFELARSDATTAGEESRGEHQL